MPKADRANISGRRLSLAGLSVNIALAAVKLVAGLLGHSYALVADSIESMADIFASMITWGSLRISAQPPDAKHPYGHGKAEPIAAFVVASMLIVAGLGIAVAAVREIVTPHHAPAAFTLWILLGVMLIKEILFRLGRRLARKTGSSVLAADAWHHRSDALTSAAAAIGISVAIWGGQPYAWADDAAAIAACCIIMWNGVRLLKDPLHELMDVQQPDLIHDVREVASTVRGVRGIETAQARKSGAGYWVDLHVEVDPEMTVRAAHDVAHRVKDAVRAARPDVVDVLIHVEPFEQDGRST